LAVLVCGVSRRSDVVMGLLGVMCCPARPPLGDCAQVLKRLR